MVGDRGEHDLLAQMRRICASDAAALDSATEALSDIEKRLLANHFSQVAAHIASRIGCRRGLPPPDCLPGSGERLELSAQVTAPLVAKMFVRNVLHRWWWVDVLADSEFVVHELTTAFVDAVADHERPHPTRMSIRLRAVSATRLVIEVHDSADNAALLESAGRLVTEAVQHRSVRCGRHTAHGHTMLWAELCRPELGRWL